MRPRIVALSASLALMSAVVATELALPSVAEDRVRDELRSIGSVTSVEVSSTPAVKLLLGSADRAALRMSTANVGDNSLDPDLLDKARALDEADARIGVLTAGSFDVHEVAITKQGEKVTASGSLPVDEVERLVPGAQLTAEDGVMVLRLPDLPIPLPVDGPLELELGVEDGNVVARPRGAAAALMPTRELLDRPDLRVQSVRGTVAGNQIRVSARATLSDA
jgi:hypothetical protein